MPKSKRDISTFNATHDPATVIPNKIRAALARMLKDGGKEAYAYEFVDKTGAATFSKLADTGSAQLAQHRLVFKDHIVLVRQDIGSRRGAKFVWFATKEAATKARKGPAKAADFE